MVTKSKASQKEGKVKVGNLKLNKETVKDLAGADLKQVKGGLIIRPRPSIGCPQPTEYGSCRCQIES